MTAYKDSIKAPELPWLEGGLRFKCTGCGKCCTGSAGYVYLTKTDLARLAAHLEMPPGAFARQYTRKVLGRRALVNGGSSDCVFLANKTCTVYEARPTQCRTYPWWLSNIRDQESWDEAAQVCEGINHPTAQLIPASDILEQCRTDIENDSALQPYRP